MKKNYKYIYGPVNSWRLGSSLGIDIISNKEKICSYGCIYCQLGSTEHFTSDRKIYVKTKNILQEFKELYKKVEVDYVTFSGSGEPTLASNLGGVIKGLKKIQKNIPIAVITNSSLIHRKDVKGDLKKGDFIMFKLDAGSRGMFNKMNSPESGIKLRKIINGIKEFDKIFKGKLALQIMFVEENKKEAKKLSKIAREINPDEVQINTPLRPCKVEALSKEELKKVKKEFKGLNIKSVYEDRKDVNKVEPIDKEAVKERRE